MKNQGCSEMENTLFSAMRTSLHFAHELAAMDFGGGFARSKFSGDLFIEQSADDERKYLAFARCERCEARSRNGYFCIPLMPCAVPFWRHLCMASSKSWSRNGFVRNSIAPAFRDGDISMSSDNNNRHAHAALRQSLLEIQRSFPAIERRERGNWEHPAAWCREIPPRVKTTLCASRK